MTRRWAWALGLLAVAGAARGEGLYERPVLRIEAGMHTAPIKAIDADSAGKFVITASEDKTIRIWRASDGTLMQVLRPPIGPGPEGKLYAAAISPDGRWVATGGWTKGIGAPSYSIYVFARNDGRIIRQLKGLRGAVKQLMFSVDGRWLAATTSGGLYVYQSNSWGLHWVRTNCTTDSYGVAFTSGGLLQTCLDGKVRHFDLEGSLNAQSSVLVGKAPMGVSVGRSGHAVVGFEDVGKLQVLERITLRPLHTIGPDRGGGSLANVIWTGQSLVAAGVFSDQGRHMILRWSTTIEDVARSFPVSGDTVLDLARLPRGRIAWASGEPSWGVVGPYGRPVHSTVRPTIDYRHVVLSTDPSGRVLNLSGEGSPDISFTIDLTRSFLHHESTRDSLKKPRTDGLPVEGWEDGYRPSLHGRRLHVKQYEKSRSLSIDTKTEDFVLGTEWYIRRFDQGRSVHVNIR